jgi:hypothetical protein
VTIMAEISSESVINERFRKDFEKLWDEVKEKLSDVGVLEQLDRVKDKEDLEKMIREVREEYEVFRESNTSKKKQALGTRVQGVCTSLSKFLECYGGIADLAKGLHPRGGSLGYGMLSLLLTVGGLNVLIVMRAKFGNLGVAQ